MTRPRKLLLRLRRALRPRSPKTKNHNEKEWITLKRNPIIPCKVKARKYKARRRENVVHCSTRLQEPLFQCAPMIRTQPQFTPWWSRQLRARRPQARIVQLKMKKRTRRARFQPQKRSLEFSRCPQPLQLPILVWGPGRTKKERASPQEASLRGKSQQRPSQSPTSAHCELWTRLLRSILPSRTWKFAKMQNLQIKHNRRARPTASASLLLSRVITWSLQKTVSVPSVQPSIIFSKFYFRHVSSRSGPR